MVTDDEITQALHEHATPMGEDRWYFTGSYASMAHAHPEAEARTIVRVCLTLGCPVTDIISSALYAALMDRLLAAEDRIARLESGGALAGPKQFVAMAAEAARQRL